MKIDNSDAIQNSVCSIYFPVYLFCRQKWIEFICLTVPINIDAYTKPFLIFYKCFRAL